MSVLVTGGAGYVGGVVVEHLKAMGESVVVVDSLARATRASVPEDVPFFDIDVAAGSELEEILRIHDVDCCMHFAGLISVGESVRQPNRYHKQNVAGTIDLLTSLERSGVEMMVFSSSAAVYGEPLTVPIEEDHRHAPTSPYGWSKSAVESILAQLATAGTMRSISLRYFNAAGSGSGRQEMHDPETHLIPLALDATHGSRELVVFGDDYDTSDGTAVRDYVHVDDLATAHVAALKTLRAGGFCGALNLGNGSGYSVLEVIAAVESVTGSTVPYDVGPRRAGDPATLVASSALARDILGWRPMMPDLRDIVASAHEARTSG